MNLQRILQAFGGISGVPLIIVVAGNVALLVIIGGIHVIRGEGMSQNTVDVYHLNSGNVTWSHRGSSSPYAWTGAGSAVHHHQIYMGGGRTSHGIICSSGYGPCIGSVSTRRAARYNPIDDSWQILNYMKGNTMDGPAFFVHGEKLYSIYNGKDGLKQEFLDLKTDYKGWSQHEVNISSKVIGSKSASNIGTSVYITGRGEEMSTVVMFWDPDKEEAWKPVANMSVPRDQTK